MALDIGIRFAVAKLCRRYWEERFSGDIAVALVSLAPSLLKEKTIKSPTLIEDKVTRVEADSANWKHLPGTE